MRVTAKLSQVRNSKNRKEVATLKLSGFLKGVSGRAGNAVYRLTKNGTELSDRPIVNNPQTKAQSDVRAAFSKATKAWKNLTTAQADAWNAYALTISESDAVSGAVTHRSGFNWYVALSSRYYLINGLSGTAPSTPPATAFTGDGLTFTLAPAESGSGIQITASGANSTGVETALMIQKLSSANGKPQKNGYRTKDYFKFTPTVLSAEVAVSPGYYAVAIQYAKTSTGQETTMQVIGEVGPITFAVAQGGSNGKKKAA